jgi:protein-S-isoprenylcysteine O-methyltransferase Ste14
MTPSAPDLLARAQTAVFRVRYWLHLAVYVLGFWAPWNYAVAIDPPGPNAHVWGLLTVNLYQAHLLGITAAFNLLLSLGIVFAFAGAFLRTWGSAYLGANVVKDGGMHTAVSVAPLPSGLQQDGPFRYMRNPLYVGTFLHTVALALLMPRSGAIFAIVAIAGLQLVLIAGEEHFLTAKLGQAYLAYCALVPRLFPRLRPGVAGTGAVPRWGQAFLGEIYFWLVAASYAFAGWQYNARILMQCVFVSFGISLVARAFTPRVAVKPPTA